MFRTVVHKPHRIKACKCSESIWITALDQEESGTTARGGDITIFLSPAQAVALRDQFNAMDLGETR